MRDPRRIYPFLKKLQECWEEVPDWRFGQLMCNFLGDVATKTNRDVFFIEDEEMLSLLEEYFKPAEEVQHEET